MKQMKMQTRNVRRKVFRKPSLFSFFPATTNPSQWERKPTLLYWFEMSKLYVSEAR